MEKKRVRRLFIADYLITPERIIPNGAVLFENQRIIGVGGASAFTVEKEIEMFHFGHAYITPGFIDTHIHGAGGCDCSCCLTSPNDLSAMSKMQNSCAVQCLSPVV